MNSTHRSVLSLTLALIISPATLLPAQASQREQENAWAKVIRLAETLIGEGGVFDAKGAEGKIDALIDLHAEFCRDVLGKPVPSQRVVLVKQGFRIFLKTATDRYAGDKRQATLLLLRDLAANRAVFVELLSTDSPAEAIEQHLLGYLERNQNLSYKEPVPVGGQLKVPNTNTALRIVADAMRLVGDQGTSGHYNRAIDAGEIITLNIPLKNFADHPFRSTSAILETSDVHVRANVSKVIYTERSVVGGETITFAPGSAIAPRQNFSFTISPNCPDKHEVQFSLHVGDSDYGEFSIPFSVVVYHVGPLDFGSVKIDDDRFGDSDGNINGIMEPHETIEYVLPLRNVGVVEVTDISATLFCSEPKIRFKPGYNESRYKVVPPQGERSIPASFVFTLEGGDKDFQPHLYLRLLTKANARGFGYSWLRTQAHPVGVSDELWAKCLAEAKNWTEASDASLASYKRLTEGLTGGIAEERFFYRLDDKTTWPLITQLVTKLCKRTIEDGEFNKAIDIAQTFLRPTERNPRFVSAIPVEFPNFKAALETILREAGERLDAKQKAEAKAKQEAEEAQRRAMAAEARAKQEAEDAQRRAMAAEARAKQEAEDARRRAQEEERLAKLTALRLVIELRGQLPPMPTEVMADVDVYDMSTLDEHNEHPRLGGNCSGQPTRSRETKCAPGKKTIKIESVLSRWSNKYDANAKRLLVGQKIQTHEISIERGQVNEVKITVSYQGVETDIAVETR